MKKRRYRATESRLQGSLFPRPMEGYVGENNPVRVIEAFVDELDLRELGFCHTEAEPGAKSNQPTYDPAILLKALIYGYLDQVQSSRLLEQELYRNVELIWLTCNSRPSYRTLSGFRQANHAALIEVLTQFMLLLKQMGLLGGKDDDRWDFSERRWPDINSLCAHEGLQDKLKRIKEYMAQVKQWLYQLRASGESQISTVDADGGGQKPGGEL